MSNISSGFDLLSHRDPLGTVAYRAGRAVSVSEFLTDAYTLARALPPATHVLNACANRYRFAVGLAAALVSGRVSLLPPTHASEMVRQLQTFAPDVICLVDGPSVIVLPQFDCCKLDPSQHGPATNAMPTIPHDRVVAQVFTSGSTGLPLPHRKTWGALVRNVRVEAERLGLNDGRSHTIVGTVPPQHMYGFESTLLVAWQSGNAFSDAHPFYPADIAAALAAVPEPRTLVSTPVHLRALHGAPVTVPKLETILSATAPLDATLAQEIEQRLDAPLLEIYGSTETGQIASRRTAQGALWELFPQVELSPDAVGGMWASGGHVEATVPMGDVIEMHDERHFTLHGRMADLVNIAGKRNSLAYLNHQLLAIDGVQDGVFFMPDDRGDDTTRLQAFVVAPGMSTAALQQALRQRIDPVFMPRPLVLLDALPRNSTGKLPRDVLQALALAARSAPHRHG